ncbi:sulfite exporter TauE/SafE family protein [Desulfogranum japonicum]|uniref:sulfite exporter TauE/SafE family protein n=1 Tax=Desulfogranum japonicum TaxID=231447 RepID=UPI0004021E6D|nr:sulfite exporter TauE/SafE family protein [Desulfogranum japonicum]
MEIILLYLALGAFGGVLAGLLGIGGGLVIVPMLTFSFAAQGIPHEHILHLALGTSLTSIIFTSISSLLAHHKRGAVIWPTVISLTPGILIGTFFGTWVAAQLSTNFLKIFFGVFLLYVATQMLLGIKPKASRELPGTTGMFASGSIIGIFSSLVGIGGGTLSVPFLVFHNTAMHKAIGTAAAIGLPIALAGSAGNILNGWSAEGLPAGCIGYVYLTALIGIVAASVCTAPLGAKLAHSLPVAKLKRIFAILLYVVGIKMLIGGL